jgi:hypothetical protein
VDKLKADSIASASPVFFSALVGKEVVLEFAVIVA